MYLKMLYYYLWLGSVLSIGQSNVFISKYYYRKTYSCVTNTSFAMDWIQPIDEWSTKTVSKYIQKTEALVLHKPWISKNSLKENFNHVILDQRWEEIPPLMTSFVDGKNKPLKYLNVVTNLKSDFTIPISIRIESDAHIFLCDGLNSSESNCYWFMLQFDGKESAIRKCGKKFIPSNDREHLSDPCKTPKIRRNLTSDDQKFLFGTKWSHFEIGKKGNHLFFNQFSDFAPKSIIDWVDEGKVIDVSSIIIHSKRYNGLWKIHQTNYMYVDQECGVNLGKLSKNKDNSICVSMYVAMCDHCKIKLTATGHNYAKEETYIYKQGWTQIKYIANHVENDDLTLTLSTIGNERNKFWALDKLRSCHKEEYRKIDSQGKFVCQLMSPNENLVAYDNNLVDSNSNCLETSLGNFCMPCKLLYPAGCARVQVCTTGECVCSSGYQIVDDKCFHGCPYGYYGHGCRKKCAINCNHCSNIDGTCSYCSNGYKLPRCVSLTENSPESTTISYTEATIVRNFEVNNGSDVNFTDKISREPNVEGTSLLSTTELWSTSPETILSQRPMSSTSAVNTSSSTSVTPTKHSRIQDQVTKTEFQSEAVTISIVSRIGGLFLPLRTKLWSTTLEAILSQSPMPSTSGVDTSSSASATPAKHNRVPDQPTKKQFQSETMTVIEEIRVELRKLTDAIFCVVNAVSNKNE